MAIDTNDANTRAALVLVATRAIAAARPHLPRSEHEARARWLAGKGAIGLDGGGALYMLPSAIEDCRQAGLVTDPTDGAPEGRTPRERRAARLDSAERVLQARLDAARAPRVRTTSKEINAAVAEAALTDERLVGTSDAAKNARALVRERAWEAATSAARSNGDDGGRS